MRLAQADIERYRSIRERMTLIVEPTVTVVLGPNDHGKTNLLNALQHFNKDHPFDEDDDLNWDSAQDQAVLPLLVGRFVLTDKEQDWLMTEENKARNELNLSLAQGSKDGVPTEAITEGELAQDTQQSEEKASGAEVEESDNELSVITRQEVPKQITLRRGGLKSELTLVGLETFQQSVRDGFTVFFPRIELIAPITKLSDSVSAEDLAKGKNEFMRGIFYYAGLDPDGASILFEQTDRTQMSVTRASEQLNKTLKESWSQGKDLTFRLTHHSKVNRIELQIEDPSVTSTYVRASRRSSGFTHYFSLKTILHARQKDHPADSYILLFDEPGVFLHPSGQFDLLQVLETLSMESQIVYVTHSLFMINKTFPTRHRLIGKTSDGTKLDGKPFVSRWQAVLSAFGLTLTGSILFANHVILTEGDSDPVYIFVVIQKAVASGKCRLDMNPLAVMSTGESKHADVLLRLLCEGQPRPQIAVITDGDKGGKDRLRYVQAMLKEHSIPERQLPKDTTIEDHMPMLREVYVPSVAAYVSKLMVLDGKTKPDDTEFEARFLAHYDTEFEKGKVTQGVAEWAAKAAAEIGGISGKPSKVGIAREYATRLLQIDDKEFKWEGRTKTLVEWIQENARVPDLHPVERKILDEESK